MSAQVESRRQLVRRLREEGLTFKEIGERLGVSGVRANQIWRTAVAPSDRPEWARGLRTQTWECLRREAQWCRHEIDLGTRAGLADFSKAELLNIPNFGSKSLLEIEHLLAESGLWLREP